MSDVLFAPTMRHNLIYIYCSNKKEFEVCFLFGKVSIEKHGRILTWKLKLMDCIILVCDWINEFCQLILLFSLFLLLFMVSLHFFN